MPRSKVLRVAGSIAASFAIFAGAIIFLAMMDIMSFAMAKLMLAGLLALYFGIGFLVVVYRFVDKLK
jgi:hypothetical protein